METTSWSPPAPARGKPLQFEPLENKVGNNVLVAASSGQRRARGEPFQSEPLGKKRWRHRPGRHRLRPVASLSNPNRWSKELETAKRSPTPFQSEPPEKKVGNNVLVAAGSGQRQAFPFRAAGEKSWQQRPDRRWLRPEAGLFIPRCWRKRNGNNNLVATEIGNNVLVAAGSGQRRARGKPVQSEPLEKKSWKHRPGRHWLRPQASLSNPSRWRKSWKHRPGCRRLRAEAGHRRAFPFRAAGEKKLETTSWSPPVPAKGWPFHSEPLEKKVRNNVLVAAGSGQKPAIPPANIYNQGNNTHVVSHVALQTCYSNSLPGSVSEHFFADWALQSAKKVGNKKTRFGCACIKLVDQVFGMVARRPALPNTSKHTLV